MKWFEPKAKEVLPLQSLIKIVKTSRYYNEKFIIKGGKKDSDFFPWGCGRSIVNIKKHRDDDLQKAILLDKHPLFKNQFILFWIDYTRVGSGYCPGVTHFRIINLAGAIPNIHKVENLNKECEAGNEDKDFNWDNFEKYLPGFKDEKEKIMKLNLDDKSQNKFVEEKQEIFQPF
jgi:hypothetical protein